MTIGEAAEKFGLDRRTIDYYTNAGLINPKVEKKGLTVTRDYSVCEEELARIAIAQAMDVRPAEKYVEILRLLPKSEWDIFVIKRIEENINRITASAQIALGLANEMKERQ